MRLDPAEARERFVASPVLRLATAGGDGRPHLVPCTFAVDGSGRVVIACSRRFRTFTGCPPSAFGSAPRASNNSVRAGEDRSAQAAQCNGV